MGEISLNIRDYRDIIADQYRLRCERRRGREYLLRDFGREIGLSASFISQLHHHKCHLSLSKARHVAAKLFRTSAERSDFLDLVEARVPRAKAHREVAIRRLEQRANLPAPFPAEALDELNWRHFTLLEVAQMPGFRGEFADFADRLKMPATDLRSALALLVKHRFLDFDGGRWRCAKPNNEVATPLSSAAFQRFHLGLMERSKLAFERQQAAERQFESLILVFDRKHLVEAKEMIRKFKAEFSARFRKGDHNAVYGFGAQFFRLDEAEETSHA